MRVELADLAATGLFAEDVSLALKPGDCLCLSGDLGAGKSTFARALIRAMAAGEREDVPSPTFTLVQTYEADIAIWHADLYRLSAEDEVYELGLDEAFETAAALIEWPDRLGAATPARALRVELDFGSRGEGRIAVFQPQGPGWAPLIDALKDAI